MKKTLLNSITLAALLALAPFQSNAQIVVVNTEKTQEKQRIERSGPTCTSMRDAVVEARRPIGSTINAITNYNDAVYSIQVLGRNDYMKTQTSPGYYRGNAETYSLLRSSQQSIKAGLAYFKEDIIKMLKEDNEKGKNTKPSYLESIFDKPIFVSTNLPVILGGYEKLLDSLRAEKEICEGLERKAQERILKFNQQGKDAKYQHERITSEEKEIYGFLKEACPLRVQELDKEIQSVEKTIERISDRKKKQDAKEVLRTFNEGIADAKLLRQRQEAWDKQLILDKRREIKNKK